jgi:hypothetical protein
MRAPAAARVTAVRRAGVDRAGKVEIIRALADQRCGFLVAIEERDLANAAERESGISRRERGQGKRGGAEQLALGVPPGMAFADERSRPSS